MSVVESEPAQRSDMTEFEADWEQSKPEAVEVEVPRIYWNAISNRAFGEYSHMDPNSKGAIHRRTGFQREFDKMDQLHPNIVRAEE